MATSTPQHTPLAMATEADKTKLKEIVKDIRHAMMCTSDKNGQLHSRPMSVNGEMDISCQSGDCALWFFTYDKTSKIQEMDEHGHHCCLSFANPAKHVFLSISGKGQIVKDRAEMEKRWYPALKEWFPQGLDTADVALLRICVDQAEYWDTPSTMGKMISFMKGKEAPKEMHKAVQMHSAESSDKKVNI